MKKTTKFYIGIALAAQSFISFIMFLVHLKKNKSLSKTFLGLSVIGGLSSAYLLYTEYQLSLAEKAECDCCDDDCDCDCDCCCDDDCCDCEDECCCDCCEENELFSDNDCEIEVVVEGEEDAGEAADESDAEAADENADA